MKTGPCPNCGSKNIDEMTVTEPLLYGVVPDRVTLEVTQPVLLCKHCEERWTDWRGEEARAKVVQQFLNSAQYMAPALIRLLKVVDALMPGIGGLALQDYKIINDVPLEAVAALRRAGVKL